MFFYEVGMRVIFRLPLLWRLRIPKCFGANFKMASFQNGGHLILVTWIHLNFRQFSLDLNRLDFFFHFIRYGLTFSICHCQKFSCVTTSFSKKWKKLEISVIFMTPVASGAVCFPVRGMPCKFFSIFSHVWSYRNALVPLSKWQPAKMAASWILEIFIHSVPSTYIISWLHPIPISLIGVNFYSLSQVRYYTGKVSHYHRFYGVQTFFPWAGFFNFFFVKFAE